MHRLRYGTLVLALVLVSAIAACTSGDGEDRAGTPDATERFEQLVATAGPAEEVLRAWVQDHLSQGFIARCEDSQRPDDVGKQCARPHSERGGRLAYQLGPTFSGSTRLFILEQQSGIWTIVHEETYAGELTTIPWPLAVGANVIVTVDAECLQVRDQPGLAAVPVVCLDNGAAVTISAGPAERDGLTWWRLDGHGWSAGQWLRYPPE